MKRAIAVILASTLMLPHCSLRQGMASRDLTLAQPDVSAGGGKIQNGPELMRKYVAHLPIGSKVKIALTDGRTLKATLMVVEQDAIIVKPRTRIPQPAETIPVELIERIEIEGESNVVKAIGIGAAVGAATFLAIWAILFAIYED